MPQIPDGEKEIIKNRVRYYIAAQGGRWVPDSEIGQALGHDREFIGQLRKEIREEDLKKMSKWKIVDAAIKVMNTYEIVSQELWGIAFGSKDQEGKVIPIKSKIYALVKLKEMEKELVELFQSIGVWPRTITADMLKEPSEFRFDVIELLQKILDVLSVDEKQKVVDVVGEYAENMTKPKQAESEQTVPEPQQPKQEQATPEQDKSEQQPTLQPEQQPAPQVESKIYEI